MIKPLSLFIGWRYTRAKKRSGFVSFISLASVLGIALGVTVLITVLSVMNGFDSEIRARFFTVAPHVTINFPGSKIPSDWSRLSQSVLADPDVKSMLPFATGKAMLAYNRQLDGLVLMGVRPQEQLANTDLKNNIVEGSFLHLSQKKSSQNPHPKRFQVAIGYSLAQRLNLHVGDKFTVITPRYSVNITGVSPVQRPLTVCAIYKAVGVDSAIAYVNIDDAKALFANQVELGEHLRLANIYDAVKVSKRLEAVLGSSYFINNWTTQFGALSQALGMEKTMLFFILLLIVAVAAFNLVSTLVMVVTDKQADIAILKTLGAKPRTIMMSFVFQGMIIGSIGAILGLLLGVLLASNISSLSLWIQSTFHVHLISEQVYGVNYLPSKLSRHDVLWVTGLSFLMCLLATLYPAWLAFRTQPAEALRYE